MSSTSDHFDLRGKVAVVTGAGGGLGRSHALVLAARGARVIVNDYGAALDGTGSSVRAADAVVEEIRGQGGDAIASHHGVHESASASAIVDLAMDRYGAIDILVCNAGIWSSQPFEQLSDDLWHRTIAVHLSGTMFVTRAAWPHMMRNGHGRVIFTSSAGGLYGKAGLSAYGAAKAGIYGLMRCLALEVEGADICVNTILPGAATRMISPGTAALWASDPMIADPRHPSSLVAYLASAACRTNGHAYSVGGGFIARDEMMEARGVRLPHEVPASPEQIAEQWESIDGLSDPRRFDSALSNGANMFGLTKDPA